MIPLCQLFWWRSKEAITGIVPDHPITVGFSTPEVERTAMTVIRVPTFDYAGNHSKWDLSDRLLSHQGVTENTTIVR